MPNCNPSPSASNRTALRPKALRDQHRSDEAPSPAAVKAYIRPFHSRDYTAHVIGTIAGTTNHIGTNMNRSAFQELSRTERNRIGKPRESICSAVAGN